MQYMKIDYLMKDKRAMNVHRVTQQMQILTDKAKI
jgi:hypothetical protein